MDIEKFYQNEHIKKIIKLEPKLEKAIKEFYVKVAGSMRHFKPPTGKSKSIWVKNKALEKQIDAHLQKLHDDVVRLITSSVKEAWELADIKNDKLIKNYIKGIVLSDSVKEGMFARNAQALRQFLLRKKDGMNLSQRVWRYLAETKNGIEFYLETGIGTGRSAISIATDLKQFLEQPKAFRRTRDESDKLVPSKRMREYEHIPGVYRDPHKNTLRLARTETNIAYRSSDMRRIRQMPFVIGYEVHLSRSHPKYDICDHMKGVYPKSFWFTGWHPNCFCYVTSILAPREDFVQYLKTGKMKTPMVSAIPSDAKNYVNQNVGRIKKAKTAPYWFKENYKEKSGKVLALF